MTTSIAPWLYIRNSKKALEFYPAAFNAEQSYLLEDPDGGIIACFLVDGAAFWVSEEAVDSPSPLTGGIITSRMILTVSDPDAAFAKAIAAGAKEIYPVTESYGWRIGRIQDPFGHHWEIGKPI